MARPAGFEPTTPWFVAKYSIQLSYGREDANYIKNVWIERVLASWPVIHSFEEDHPMRIGFAGTGRMGAAMAERLLGFGHEITVWNRTPAKAARLVELGAQLVGTPAAVASASDLVMTILTDGDAIKATYLGKDGLLEGAVIGKLFVEMSTVRPEEERQLEAPIRAKGAFLIDCPVGGTVGPALAGKLMGFAGGDPAHVERASPVLGQLCRRVEHCGAVGAGAAVKLAINLPLSIYWQAFGEALALCKPLGLSPERLVNIFADTSGGPNVLTSRGPAFSGALNGTAPSPVTFDIDSIRKDIRMMIEEGASLGNDLPLTRKTLEVFDQASRDGLGAADAVMMTMRAMEK